MLYYHKCLECLTPFSSIEPKIDECDCASTNIECMGQVQGSLYVKTGMRAPCDGRCTHASGPICDCNCHGANHGTGRVVQTILKQGKVIVSDPSADIHDEMVRGYKYRELRDKAEEIYAKLFADVPRYDYNARVARQELNHALGLRVYERRQKAILEFVFKHLKQTPGLLK